MKFILLIISFTLGFQSFSFDECMPEYPDYWTIKKSFDSTLTKGQSKISFIVKNKFNKLPIENSEIHLNTNYLIGKTNSKGKTSTIVKSMKYKFCIDTPQKNSFIKFYELKSQFSYVIEVFMSHKKEIQPTYKYNEVLPEKPVIYLYPTKKQNINVKVLPKDEFLFTYPKYPENGWDVVAKPNGKIEYNNRTYNYLFWEGVSSAEYNIDDSLGFEVDSDTLIQFFEHTLTKLGLTTEEQTDFITYWGPKLQENQLNFIHFEFTEGCEKNIAILEITPKPDQVIRIFMTYHYINELEYKPIQTIPTYKRKGFTVVEWGGSYF